MGLKNPKRAIYNAIYHKTSIDGLKGLKQSKLIYGIQSKTEIKKFKKSIPKDKKTHYFQLKANCCLCNINLNLISNNPRFQLIDGFLCEHCFPLVFSISDFKRNYFTVEEVKNIYKFNWKQDFK